MSEISEHNNIRPADAVPQYVWGKNEQPEEGESPVMIRRRIKNGYNWAGSIILWQQLFAFIIMMIITGIMSAKLTTQLLSENPTMDMNQLTQTVTQQIMQGDSMVLINAVTMVAANIIALAIVCTGKKQFKLKSALGKSSLSVSSVLIAIIGAFGIQAASVLIQTLFTYITGISGVGDSLNNSLGFTDSFVLNIVLFVYMVIAGPILEELLFRGATLNLLAPVNRKFALFASSLLFGLMHCNFNQIFNGFLLGLILGYIALKSGSIIPSIIMHMMLNLNVFIIGYIFEHKLAETIGIEAAAQGELITFGVEAVIGIITLVIVLKRHGRITESDIIIPEYSYVLKDQEEKKLTWQSFIKSPSVIISIILCVITACTLVTVVGGILNK
ncbi:MAG: CPBP family intramembrane metalloprotease [Oscillospiraceae bacterium]|nr:CPBP family intramembrane metalloprotease [Oscillospiraceae bacterium]